MVIRRNLPSTHNIYFGLLCRSNVYDKINDCGYKNSWRRDGLVKSTMVDCNARGIEKTKSMSIELCKTKMLQVHVGNG